ncbi:MAG: hypothetical protein QXH17_04450, partial [Candidatus Bathyarchaeia archaeon]
YIKALVRFPLRNALRLFSRLAPARGVFNPLSREGADITLEMEINARIEKGINRSIIDHTVKETLAQIGVKIIEERSE